MQIRKGFDGIHDQGPQIYECTEPAGSSLEAMDSKEEDGVEGDDEDPKEKAWVKLADKQGIQMKIEVKGVHEYKWGRGNCRAIGETSSEEVENRSYSLEGRPGGCQSEWCLWKRFLKGTNEFLVEDSDGEFGEEEGKVRAEIKLGTGSIGIPELDDLEYESGEVQSPLY
ncbi:hypothetical protein F5146DRAFT_1004280 [Armillaria mellea]|nr:hypothetical protein F5146DRAFT_1004280 [Armillaria mellea]